MSQFTPTYTKEEIIDDPTNSPFDMVLHPVEKIESMGEIIEAMNSSTEGTPFPEISISAVYAIGSTITDACKDIRYLVDLCVDEIQKVEAQRDKYAELLKAYQPAVRLAESLRMPVDKVIENMDKGH